MHETKRQLLFLFTLLISAKGRTAFIDITNDVFRQHPESNPIQLNYGVAVSDVDNDGNMEIIVAGYNGPNLVLKWDNATQQLRNIAVDDPQSPFFALRDPQGNAIGVSACDIDGDGREEIYFLNTNQAYSGMATYGDKLFKYRNGRYEDLFADPINRNVINYFAGRSVACVDRKGTGRYSVYLANYARGRIGPHSLIEMDPDRSDPARGVIALTDVSKQAGVSKLTGGRGVTVGPITSQNASDILCVNENGPNFLFRNKGDGTFEDVAFTTGIADQYENGRGLTLADVNEDGKVDVIYGNWRGPHRIFVQDDVQGEPKFTNIAQGTAFEEPSPIRTVIAADFDNDGFLEIFLNNIAYNGPSPNRLFRIDPVGRLTEQDIGAAAEPQGRGTGAAVADLNGDGMLELIVSHGESAAQPLSIYKSGKNAATYLRVMPKTRFGAPARGAKIEVVTNKSRNLLRIIDAGSGYLCQMEPVAHFGFGSDYPISMKITWPDGLTKTMNLKRKHLNRLIVTAHPSRASRKNEKKRKSRTPQLSEIFMNK